MLDSYTSQQKKVLGITAVIVLFVLIGGVSYFFQGRLGARTLVSGETESLVGGRMSIENLSYGEHTLEFSAKTTSGKVLSDTTTFTKIDPNQVTLISIWAQTQGQQGRYYKHIAYSPTTGVLSRTDQVQGVTHPPKECRVLTDAEKPDLSAAFSGLSAFERFPDAQSTKTNTDVARGAGEEYLSILYANGTFQAAYSDTSDELPSTMNDVSAAIKDLATQYCVGDQFVPEGHILGN